MNDLVATHAPALSPFLLPHLVLAAGAVIVLVAPFHALRAALTILAPLVALALVWEAEPRTLLVPLMGFELSLMHMDTLARAFGLVFCLAAALAALYAAVARSRLQQVATLLYAAAAVGAVFAGDLVTLFVWWELTALTSVFLVWAGRTPQAYAAGMRYLGWQVASGVALFAGVAIHFMQTGSTAFDRFELGAFADTPGAWLILLAIGIKAAFPFLGGWLADAYPSATVTGTVAMSIFTTKMAIYALARGYAGTELLVAIGAVMALYPIALAILADDLRRTLAYALNSQLGFMVVGIGIGTDDAIDGAVAHAICSVLYQGLLFMAVGAVMWRGGTARVSGLVRTESAGRAMPLTFMCLLVGAASIAAVPGFSGFVSKAIVIDQAAKGGLTWVWIALVAASAGTVLHTALKLPWMLWTHGRAGLREAPWPMLAAMVLSAVLCVAIGVLPDTFYGFTPYLIEYEAYTLSHLVSQSQLLVAAALVFAVVVALGLWPAPRRAQLVDLDWLWRGLLWPVARFSGQAIGVGFGEAARGVDWLWTGGKSTLARFYGPRSRPARALATGNMALWIAILLGAALFANLLDIR